MNGTDFDALAKAFSSGIDRRRVLRGIGGGAISAALLSMEDTLGWTHQVAAQEFRPTRYLVRLNSFNIAVTRAPSCDTDVVSFSMALDGSPDTNVQKGMGNVSEPGGDCPGNDHGVHVVDLSFGPYLITDPTTPLKMAFAIVNSGYNGSSGSIGNDVAAGLADLCAKACAGFFGFGTDEIWGAIGKGFKAIVKFALPDCDGPVAGDAKLYDAASLYAWTSQANPYNMSGFYPGTDSADGCGSNSRYNVAWSIERWPADESLVPLKLYYSPERDDNYTTATAAGQYSAKEGPSWMDGFVRFEGFVSPTPRDGLVPLKLYWSPERGDNFTTGTAQGEQDALGSGYTYVRDEGYISPVPGDGLAPLKLYWSPVHEDNFTTATAQGEQDALNAGFVYVRDEGYVWI
jgi:hypothetical protein